MTATKAANPQLSVEELFRLNQIPVDVDKMMVHLKTAKAYFVKGLNIARKTVLLDLMERSGLDPVEGRHIIETRKFSLYLAVIKFII